MSADSEEILRPEPATVSDLKSPVGEESTVVTDTVELAVSGKASEGAAIADLDRRRIRKWFDSLSLSERIANTAFTDNGVLEMISSFAIQENEANPFAENSKFWYATVEIEHLKKVLLDQSTNLDGTRKPSQSSTSKDSLPFRIQTAAQSKLEIQTFVKSIVVLDSCAGKYVEEDIRGPLVCFNYFEIGNDIALIDALDVLSKKIFGHSFLEAQISSPYDLLAQSGKTEIPVYAILLAAFVSSCCKAFVGNDTINASVLEKLRAIGRSLNSFALKSEAATDTLDTFASSVLTIKPKSKVVPSSLIFMPIPAYLVRVSVDSSIDAVSTSIEGVLDVLVRAEEASKSTVDSAQTPSQQKKKKSKRKKSKKKKAANDAESKDTATPPVPKMTPSSGSTSWSARVSVDRIKAETGAPAMVTPPQASPKTPSVPKIIDESLYSHDSDETESAESEVILKPPTKIDSSDIAVSKVEGVTVVSTPAGNSLSSTDSDAGGHEHGAEGDNWETVGSRIRKSGKKSDRSASISGKGNSQSGEGGGGAKKKKSNPRKKHANRKMVREILGQVIDSVDELSEQKKKAMLGSRPLVASSNENPWNVSKAVGGSPGVTMRDIVAGKGMKSPLKTSTQERNFADIVSASKGDISPTRKSLTKSSANADSNTAPTFQETVSAHSNLDKNLKTASNTGTKSDSSSGETDEVVARVEMPKSISSDKESSANPPLPTLLNPEQAYSSTSSVASSLEMPKRHYPSSVDESNPVGYHVLQVCERLTTDLNEFMKRRAQALKLRRQERGALLAALQDSVSSIWPGRCHVEMYGSCATQLDLPSSDLDVVVLGLDATVDAMHGVRPELYERVSKSIFEAHDGPKRGKGNLQIPPYTTRTPNGNRIMALASQIEEQPWAVQVNALPGATVPVVKILADPSKMAVSDKKWLIEHQRYANEAAAAAGITTGSNSSPGSTSPDMKEPWRGHDVMNGLISLDVTFQGPEHGGVGSTEFSARSVNEACSEFGKPPDATPFVQVLMVLKEMLAQRKLNEPYSGGLSSYALLLLVVSLQRERALIRDEIERAERQRQAVASESVGDSFPAIGGGSTQPMHRTSSWASIAKKPTSGAERKLASLSGEGDARKVPDKKPSFADAVAKRVQAVPKHDETPELKEARGSVSDKKDDSSITTTDPTLASPSFFNQSYNDIVEVLCSGETTSGKLLMHFLLYYGHYFDAQKTAIDLSGKHDRKLPPGAHRSRYDLYSPYIERTQTGTIDPRTGMLTVDPVVVYDPLEGAETNNVARRCFAWRNVKWTFANAYSTLSKIVEESVAPSKTESDANDAPADLTDPSSPLLKCLLSF